MGAIATMAAAALLAVTPGGDYQAALADIGKQPEQLRSQTRYVSYRNLRGPDVVLARRLTDYHLNAMAALQTGGLAKVQPAGGNLARVTLGLYAPTPEALARWHTAWEGLAAANYSSHFATQAISTADDGSQTLEVSQVRGGWLPAQTAEGLELASTSAVAVVEFEAFLAQVMTPAVYYQWTGAGDRDATLALLGVQPELIASLRAGHAATIRSSDVALGKPRRVHEWRGLFGGAWFTDDVDELTAATDYVRHPLAKLSTTAGEEVLTVATTANEWVLVGRNGLPVFLITTAAGERLDEVDPRVARDYSEPHARFNGLITAPLGCIRCHALSGFQPISDYQQTLQDRGQVADSPATAARIAEIYRWDLLARQLEYDGQTVETATRSASGLSWAEVSHGTGRLWRDYVLDPVSLERAALELGTSQQRATEVLGLLSDPWARALAHGETVPREAWVTIFPQAMIQAAASQ